MFYAALSLLGVFSYLSISVEGQPDVALPQLVVRTNWLGTSPEVIQVFLTSPIEEEAAQVKDLEELTSQSTRGRSQVVLKFDRETDMDYARMDLNERLSQLRRELPPGASQPSITLSVASTFGSQDFMSISVSGPYNINRLYEIVDDTIANDIRSVSGVAEVLMYGETEKEVRVELDRDAMDLYGLVPDQVMRKINQLDVNYESTRADFDNQEYSFVIQSGIWDLDEVREMVIQKKGDRLVRVRDLGKVFRAYSDPLNLSRISGNPTIRMDIEKEIGANLIETAKAVKATVSNAEASFPHGIRYNWVRDEGQLMSDQLTTVYYRSLWCLILIAILLLFFLRSFSAAVVITLNIAFSVLVTLNFMYYFDVTVNMVTLSGLAIGFGMLVDNAIVVLENIFRLRELGCDRFHSAWRGAREVSWPLLASTLTTVAAFLCMLFLEDRLAATFLPLAISVIFSLSASLMVSFTFTPLLSMFIKGSALHIPGKSAHENLIQVWLGKMLVAVSEGYRRLVLFSLTHKFLIISFTLLIFGMFAWIFHTEIDRGGFSFGRSRDDMVGVYIRLPQGAELETANDVIRQFEKPLLNVEGYKDVTISVRSNFAHLQVSFDDEILASAFPTALKSKLVGIAQGFAGIGITVYGINSDDNYYSGFTGFESYNSTITLMGYNYKKLMDFSRDIVKQVRRNRRVKDTDIQTSQSGFRGARDETETVLLINREKLKNYPLSMQYLMGFIQRNLKLESMTRIKYKGEEVALEVKFNDSKEFDLKDLEALVIKIEGGQDVRLLDLMSLETRKVSGGIDRKDQQYAVRVRWDYKGSSKKARNFRQSVFSSLDLPPGFSAELDHTEDLSEEEDANLLYVIVLAILVVFMIIAALYESFVDPFVILLTIPLAFTGVSWIYWYTDHSFDSTAYIGLVILAGIVVNNSILIVSHFNDMISRMDETGLSVHETIAKAAQDRFRPVLLTAITTIVGLLPLLDDFVGWFLDIPGLSHLIQWIGLQGQNSDQINAGLETTLDMFSSLSRTTVGGMLSATLSTLIIIPVVYVIFFRFKQWSYKRVEELAALKSGR
jgi:HAE1 family hydrophobic/amphiphilic exporter-1